MLFEGRRWIQPAEAAKLLGLSPHYFKRLLYEDRIDGFTIETRVSRNGRVFHWIPLDEVMRATDGADLSRRMRGSRDSED